MICLQQTEKEKHNNRELPQEPVRQTPNPLLSLPLVYKVITNIRLCGQLHLSVAS